MNSNGISFQKVRVTELNFKVNPAFVPPKDGIPVDVDFNTKSSLSADKKTLTTQLSARLFQKNKKAPFTMTVTVEGVFKGASAADLDGFSKIHAPAHLFPFLREIIGSTTMRANMPPLLLPPVNLTELSTAKRKKAPKAK